MRDNKELTVSDLIDVSRLKLDEFNLIVSGCGTGKSYFAINQLINMVNKQFNKNIEGYEVWFVTSRKITKLQQLNDIKYKDKLKPLSEWGCELLTQSELIKKDIFNLSREYRNKIAIMTYNQFDMCIKDKLADKLRIIIFDECHALISDRSYISIMNNILDFIFKTLSKKSNNTFLVGVTATDHLVKKETFHVKMNYILDEPFFKYKVLEKIYISKSIYLNSILDDITGKTIVMTDDIKKIVELRNKYENKCMIAISDNKVLDSCYNKKIKEISDEDKKYIIDNKSLRDDVQYFFGTSCSREGFEFDSDKVKIDNVIVCSSLVTDVIQFAGRYRGNIKNLYILSKYKYGNSMNAIEEKQMKKFNNYFYNYDKNYFKEYKIFDENINYLKYSDRKSSQKLIEYINEKWINIAIFTSEQKNEITTYANYLGLRNEKRNPISWKNIINDRHLEFIINNERLRKNDERIKKCDNYNDIVKCKQDRITCTVFKKKRIRK